MIKTNIESLVEISVTGEIWHPRFVEGTVFTVGYDGTPYVGIGYAGITYNVKVGDPAFGWAWGEHIEPGVSIRNTDTQSNAGLLTLACIGNEATIINATLESKEIKVKGCKGIVTGKHGGANRVMIYFPTKILENLCIGDKIQIRSSGMGLKLIDYPDITVMNCGPTLLKTINPSEKGNKVRIQVAKVIPGKIMGSGIGSTDSFRGDFDIQSTSPDAIKEYSLDSIRIGDFVAITDYDCTYGRRWQNKSITIGVVIHGASKISGHGPGVTVLFTSPKDIIEPIITRKANIANLLGLD